jgi:hypothetical protein
MYALIVPLLTPFVLLATVMGLSWLEDHVLPPAKVAEAAADSPPAADLRAELTAVVKLDPLRLEGAVDRAGVPELTDAHGAAL